MLLLMLHLVKLVVLYTHEICDCVLIVLRSSALQYDDCFEEENAFSKTGCSLVNELAMGSFAQTQTIQCTLELKRPH